MQILALVPQGYKDAYTASSPKHACNEHSKGAAQTVENIKQKSEGEPRALNAEDGMFVF
jgi:hypothetical protein